MLQNKTEILKMLKLNTAVKQLDSIEDSIQLGNLFGAYKLLFALEKDPRHEEESKLKYPKHLVPSREQKFKDKGFYSWMVPKPSGKLAFYLVIGIIIAITFMLFNLWPLWLKIGIWYFSFYTLMFLLGLILIRLTIWLFLFHFGLDLWIFPNLFADNLGPIESFFPLYSFEKRQDDSKMLGLRVLSAISLVILVYMLSREPENLESLSSFTNDSMNDIFNWGNDRFVLGRIEDKSANGTVKRKKTPQ